MAKITDLPDEVIGIILGDPNISLEDTVSFISTCTRLYQTIQTKKFWEMKFFRRCPTASKKYSTEERQKILNYLDLKEKIITSIKCMKYLHYYVNLMFNNDSLDTNKKELECFLISIAEDSMIYYFVLDEISRIVSPDIYLCNLNSNLVNIYNFERINYYLRQHRFIYKLNKFLNMPKEKQLFERLIIIMAQYFQPWVSYSITETFLDDIAHEVISFVKNKYPKHSIFSTSFEQISFWRDNNIERNFWNRTEALQIIEILEEFNTEYKLNRLLETLDVENESIIEILCERKFLQTIIYQSVARRLGIYCCATYTEIDTHYYRKAWRPKYNVEDMEGGEYYFKEDNSNSFAFHYPLNNDEWIYNTSFCMLNPIKEIRMTMFCLYESLRCYEHRMYESTEIFNTSLFICLNRWFSRYKSIKEINIETEYSNITELLEDDRSDISFFEKSEQPKRRNKEIKFAIGMVVTHTPYADSISYDGVIIGWHFECDGAFNDQLMQVFERNSLNQFNHQSVSKKLYLLNTLTKFDRCMCRYRSYETPDCIKQPHYIILTDTNEICYTEQDVVSKCPTIKRSKLINNVEIGRYFTRFEGTHYVPNEHLAKIYPDDTAAILEILSSQ